ncbi:MAG: DUF937 domain-containing protein [Chitinophagales bacterium]|jgi:hypothetical protein
MDLMELLKGQLNDQLIGQLSQHIGAEPQQTASAAEGVFATILGGLANNAASEGGVNSLMAALDRDHDGSILDDLMGMVGNLANGTANGNATNGLGILGHVLGDRQETAAAQIGQSNGLSAGQAMKLMTILAPIVMNVLGKAKSQGGLDVGSLVGMLMGSAQNAQQGGFGDLIGSVIGNVMSGNQQQANGAGGMLGSVLGSLFGKK